MRETREALLWREDSFREKKATKMLAEVTVGVVHFGPMKS